MAVSGGDTGPILTLRGELIDGIDDAGGAGGQRTGDGLAAAPATSGHGVALGPGQSGRQRCVSSRARPPLHRSSALHRPYVVGFYNPVRLRSTLGYLSPCSCEATLAAKQLSDVSEIT
ncbi:hypothetical protein, partial [Ralstonia pseudosolanacearum]|uniref:hypothetical protein n=1 Tax=Ralstonia pseudosolanacearum TaxID=1310165 RepID=UPI001E58FDB0